MVPIDASVDIPAVTITGTTISAIPLGFRHRTSAGPLNILIIVRGAGLRELDPDAVVGSSTPVPAADRASATLGAGRVGLLNQAGRGVTAGTLLPAPWPRVLNSAPPSPGCST